MRKNLFIVKLSSLFILLFGGAYSVAQAASPGCTPISSAPYTISAPGQYCLTNDMNLDEAVQWADRSIGIQETFNNLSTKAQLLTKTGEAEQAGELMAKAMDMGNRSQSRRSFDGAQ